jgi:hypothetical protein
MTPMQIQRMQLVRPSHADREWLHERMASVSKVFGCDVTMAVDGTLVVQRLVSSLPRP